MDVPPVCVPFVSGARRRGLLLGLLLGALVIAVVATALFFLVPRPTLFFMTAPIHRTRTLAPQRHSSAMRLSLPSSSSSSPLLQGRDCLLVPAIYSEEDEGYVIRMRLGVDNVLVVLDSGSANLTVGTATCVKEALCSAHDGAYRPEASARAINLHKPATLQYASVSMEATWWQDVAALQFVKPPRGGACPAPPALEAVETEAELPGLLPVAAARRMDGTASNILGLMGAHAGQVDLPVLEHMLVALGLPRRWSLAAYADGAGWLVLGKLPACFPSPKYVPLSSKFLYMGAPCVDIRAVRYRAPNGAWRALPPGAFPAHAVCDTGTAESYITAPFTRSFEDVVGLPHRDARVGKATVDALPEIQLELASGITIVYSSAQYMVPAENGAFRCTVHCGDDKIASLFGNAPVMLVGIHHMFGLLMEVDLERGRVGFARL